VQLAGGTPSERYGFAHREHDPESGLVHMRARMYDPRLGRFTQNDPAIGNRSSKHYVYTGNNPVSMIDPQGLQEHGTPLTPDEVNWMISRLADKENPVAIQQLGVFQEAGVWKWKVGGRDDEYNKSLYRRNHERGTIAALDWKAYLRQAEQAERDLRAMAQWGQLTLSQRVARYLRDPNDPLIRAYWENDPAAREHFIQTVESGLEAAGWFNIICSSILIVGGPSFLEHGIDTKLTPEAAKRLAERFRALAWDPARKGYNWREAVQVVRFQRHTGITLTRGAHAADDFIAGQTRFSFVGGQSSRHFHQAEFQRAIRRKLLDETTRVVVDVGTFSKEQAAGVEKFIETLSEAERARIFILR